MCTNYIFHLLMWIYTWTCRPLPGRLPPLGCSWSVWPSPDLVSAVCSSLFLDGVELLTAPVRPLHHSLCPLHPQGTANWMNQNAYQCRVWCRTTNNKLFRISLTQPEIWLTASNLGHFASYFWPRTAHYTGRDRLTDVCDIHKVHETIKYTLFFQEKVCGGGSKPLDWE